MEPGRKERVENISPPLQTAPKGTKPSARPTRHFLWDERSHLPFGWQDRAQRQSLAGVTKERPQSLLPVVRSAHRQGHIFSGVWAAKARMERVAAGWHRGVALQKQAGMHTLFSLITFSSEKRVFNTIRSGSTGRISDRGHFFKK